MGQSGPCARGLNRENATTAADRQTWCTDSDGPPEYPYGDNWTNVQEWQTVTVNIENKYRTVPVFEFTDPFGAVFLGNDTDGDKINDDVDLRPMKLPIMPALKPIRGVALGAALNPIFPGDALSDSDNDNMLNLEEYRRPMGQTDPTDPDTDADNMPDGWEWGYGKYSNVTQTVNPDPLNDHDALLDPDQDGINYSRKWFDTDGDKKKDPDEMWDIGERDFNGDGVIDPIWENETFCTIEEYMLGIDIDADGFMEMTTDPNKNDTDEDVLTDGYEVMFSDPDGDRLPNWFEIVYSLNPNDNLDLNGSAGDPDGDGFNNTAEYRCKPWPTNPNDADSYPGRSSDGMTDYGTGSRDLPEIAPIHEPVMVAPVIGTPPNSGVMNGPNKK